MEPQKQVVVFLAEFDYQVKQMKNAINILKEKIRVIGKKPISVETVESAGYWMHNLYCAFEDLFKLVAGFWENDLIVNGEFHAHLLKRMILNIEGVRPPLLSETSYRLLNELRGFRHVFRHAYGYGLDDERVGVLLRKILDHEDTFHKDLKTFRKTIADLIKDQPG